MSAFLINENTQITSVKRRFETEPDSLILHKFSFFAIYTAVEVCFELIVLTAVLGYNLTKWSVTFPSLFSYHQY